MKRLMQRNTVVALLVLVALVLGACTRSVSSGTVPTSTTVAAVGPAGSELQSPDTTMSALATALVLQTTQAAAGGDTPVPPPAGGATPTPIPPTAALPAGATPVPAAGGGCPSPYIVKSGDWIYKIAHDCKVEPSAIIAANPGINPNFISPGQKLTMPGAGATAVPPATPQACKGTHTVVQGENLFRIAYNCGLTTEQLASVNGIKYPYLIHPGDVLKFP